MAIWNVVTLSWRQTYLCTIISNRTWCPTVSSEFIHTNCMQNVVLFLIADVIYAAKHSQPKCDWLNTRFDIEKQCTNSIFAISVAKRVEIKMHAKIIYSRIMWHPNQNMNAKFVTKSKHPFEVQSCDQSLNPQYGHNNMSYATWNKFYDIFFRFQLPNLLRNHFYSVHREKKRDQTCEICGMSFHQKFHLNKHMHVDVSERLTQRVKCEHCGEWLMSKSGVYYHKQIHTTGVQKCDECQIEVPNRNSLLAHIRKYHREQKFKCSFCNKAFQNGSLLKVRTNCYLFIFK